MTGLIGEKLPRDEFSRIQFNLEEREQQIGPIIVLKNHDLLKFFPLQQDAAMDECLINHICRFIGVHITVLDDKPLSVLPRHSRQVIHGDFAR